MCYLSFPSFIIPDLLFWVYINNRDNSMSTPVITELKRCIKETESYVQGDTQVKSHRKKLELSQWNFHHRLKKIHSFKQQSVYYRNFPIKYIYTYIYTCQRNGTGLVCHLLCFILRHFSFFKKLKGDRRDICLSFLSGPLDLFVSPILGISSSGRFTVLRDCTLVFSRSLFARPPNRCKFLPLSIVLFNRQIARDYFIR